MSKEKALKNNEVVSKPEKKKTNWVAKIFTKECRMDECNCNFYIYSRSMHACISAKYAKYQNKTS